jgi:hypothetical protein
VLPLVVTGCTGSNVINSLDCSTLSTQRIPSCLSPVSTFAPTVSTQAWAIEVRYRGSDLPILQKANPSWGLTSSINTSTQSSATPTSITTTPLSSTPSSNNTPQGISQGTEFAIGLTIPIFNLILIGTFLFFRRRKRGAHIVSSPSRTNVWAKTELPGEEIRSELEGKSIVQRQGVRSEVEGQNVFPQMLPDNSHHPVSKTVSR